MTSQSFSPRQIKVLEPIAVAAYFKKVIKWTKENMNRIIIIVGNPGSGKSWTALAYMYLLYAARDGRLPTPETFPFENITFDPLTFLERVEQTEGEVIMFDEGGVGANARRWYTKSNIAISQVIQTMRFKRHVILVTVPRLSMIDKHLRDLAHELHIVTGVRKNNKNLVWVRELSYYAGKDKEESNRLYPAFYLPQYRLGYLIKAMWVGAPPKWLADKYEEMSREYKEKVLREAKKTIAEDMGIGEVSIDDYVAKLLELFSASPKLAVSAISEKAGMAFFSAHKIRSRFADVVPREYAKAVAPRINQLVFGSEKGIDVMEYYDMLESDGFVQAIKKALAEVKS